MIRVLIFSLLILGPTFALSKTTEYVRADFLTDQQAKKKWGTKKFDSSKFKSADYREKAAMAVDAVSRQVLVGKDPIAVKAELGEPDGYLFNDTILAYQIEPYSNSHNEAWQLVFIPDKQKGMIGEVKIHKKCCYVEEIK